MSDLPATRVYQRVRDEQPAPSGGVARADLYLADAAVDELFAALAERDRMLRCDWQDYDEDRLSFDDWLADLRARVQKP